ncbi:MAG: hypothetical protein J5709_00205 [Bacteroidales bacterium]|nr:hypothetical protein [Bacteroidales bacterium]
MNAKRLLGYTVAIILLALPIVFSGCKKGDEDPFLTFRSRKARLCGTWTVSNLNSEIVRKENNISTKTVTTVEDGSWKQVITIPSSDSTRTLTGKIAIDPGQEEGTYTFFFDKNGVAKMVYKYEFDEDQSGEDDDASVIHRTEVTEEMTGSWEFLSGIDNEYKNKERIAFIIEEQKTTTKVSEIISSDDEGGAVIPRTISTNVASDRYAKGELSIVYNIVELRNKEVKLHQDVNRFHLSAQNTTSETYQENGHEDLTLKLRK